ncbi:MAG: UDP-2,3-diacylglucosamine diphosphatase [Fibrobacter sp.]|nr:UDP-2,3-diacylglucosamine diphosphatase [Fibrobacter sp.]
MELPAYFISDAHLGIDPPGCIKNREEKLVSLLKSWKGAASHVVIVGDLFEFWYEYGYYVTRNHFNLFRALADLVESGVQVHLLQGNHDFAYGDFFPTSLGVQVHKQTVLEIQGKRVLFRHGDGVAKSDFGYRLFRRILDFPLNRFLFKQIHPDWGMGLARFVGRNSRKYGENRIIKMDEYLGWANRTMKKNDCSLCVIGHHHVTGTWNVDQGVVASPGDWIKKLTYLRMEAGEISIETLE